jgi:hypothetical protein
MIREREPETVRFTVDMQNLVILINYLQKALGEFPKICKAAVAAAAAAEMTAEKQKKSSIYSVFK